MKIKDSEMKIHFGTMLQRYKELLANRRFIMMKLIASNLFSFTTTLFNQPWVILIAVPKQLYSSSFFVCPFNDYH